MSRPTLQRTHSLRTDGIDRDGGGGWDQTASARREHTRAHREQRRMEAADPIGRITPSMREDGVTGWHAAAAANSSPAPR